MAKNHSVTHKTWTMRYSFLFNMLNEERVKNLLQIF